MADAGAALDKENWVLCARLYNEAIQKFPSAGVRHAELETLRYNRDYCRSREPSPPLVSNQLSINVPDLIGRRAELKVLDEAWDGPKRRKVVAVVAIGGQGKTTLVVNWFRRMSDVGFRGARRVFTWSFYRNGSSADQASSSDAFLAKALLFFGEKGNEHATPFEKADRLRDLVRKQRTLLILDGLEPLQDPLDGPNGKGVLRDRPLASLLTDLAMDNPGLVVVTSRIPIGDLSAFEPGALHTLSLKPFSEPDGTALLRSLGVQGSDTEMATAVREARGHPLTLTLLGNLLSDGYGSDVRRRGEVAVLKESETEGVHARHVMEAYDRWFKGDAERAVLRLLGLFNRPAPGGALKVLRAEPKVAGLNEALVGLSAPQWNQVLARLRRAGLVEKENRDDVGAVDAHPLVREYFGEVLQKENEGAWREGHRRLYEWYAASAAKHQPDTQEEMTPLYVAVWHGCQAGRHQDAFDRVFRLRIMRSSEHYSEHKLGAWEANLSALFGFFEVPWTKPVLALREQDRALVLNEAGVALASLGRQNEAVELAQAALEANLARRDWREAANAAVNVSEIQLALGQLDQAEKSARQGVGLADRSGDAIKRVDIRATLAHVLHFRGEIKESLSRFIEAEKMLLEHDPESLLLDGGPGYFYCDLLLRQRAVGDVLRRAGQTLKWAEDEGSPLSIGLDNLSLGRAHTALLAAGDVTKADLASRHLNKAVDMLRAAGNQGYIAESLLYRAAFFRQLPRENARLSQIARAR